MAQWWMAIQKPPSLACIAAFDGMNDPYRASVYQGGILGDFFGSYWWNQNRIINLHPANGQHPREQTCDLNLLIQQHPTYDNFWRERCAAERLAEIEVPLYSVGVWGKVDLHTRGNIEGFRRASGPKKLKMIGPINAFVANREFASADMHAKVLLPFYDHYLKGKHTDYLGRPAVEYFVRGAEAARSAEAWPPPGVHYLTWHLGGQKSGSVTSLNDGSLTRELPQGESKVAYSYPNPGWMMGVVGFGPNNQPDPARRVLTFTTAPLERELEIAGPIKLVLYALPPATTWISLSSSPSRCGSRPRIARKISTLRISGSRRGGCALRTAPSMRRKARTWSHITATAIRSRSSPARPTALISASSRWRTASSKEAACGWRLLPAIPP